MRLISVDKLQPGMILGNNLYSANGITLLYRGTVLHANYINSIIKHNFSNVYIIDKFSEDIEVSDIISEETRHILVNTVKNVFIGFEDDKKVCDSVHTLNALIEAVIDEVIRSRNVIVNLLDIKRHDNYTYQHSVNVSVLSTIVGVALDFNERELKSLANAALFHDLGKIKIPLEILNKPGRLTSEEFEQIKMHPLYGYQLSKQKLNMSPHSYAGILHHHEKYDGSGYPSGKAKREISLIGRIIAVADVYDAITSNRPYRKPSLPSEAFEFLLANSSIHFDPELVKIFTRKVAAYPIGSTVILSNNKSGVVIDHYEDAPMRPKIRIISDNPDEMEEIELRNDAKYLNLTIKDMER